MVFETSDYEATAKTLASVGVRFEKWRACQELPKEFNEAAVIEAYREDVDRLIRENGYRSVDVVRMFPDKAGKEALRAKFLNEHIHTEDEVRFFVEGSGLFYLHVADQVYIVLCEKDDLISIPARYTHWFDMGKDPYFTAIRFFIEPSGWVADFTGSDISQKFPKYD
jgi:1,2-dihydroxy-3-keto-5-methylthiopentene dioxygenase